MRSLCLSTSLLFGNYMVMPIHGKSPATVYPSLAMFVGFPDYHINEHNFCRSAATRIALVGVLLGEEVRRMSLRFYTARIGVLFREGTRDSSSRSYTARTGVLPEGDI